MALAGCAVTGPAAIRNGRGVYNDAIIATNNEQVLAMIVRTRYQEPSALLAVSSVTANVRVQGNVTAQWGIGAADAYQGNLVPLSTGVVYEENPTISYTPVQGPDFLRQLLGPIPLDLVVLILNATHHAPDVGLLLIRNVNGLHNPDFVPDTGALKRDDRFRRVLELLQSLDARGGLTWAEVAGKPTEFSLVLSGATVEDEQEIDELCSLLNLGGAAGRMRPTTLPVYLGVGDRAPGAIELTTRSVYDLFELAAAGVDVPEAHVEAGLARQFRGTGPIGDMIRIRRSVDRPRGALVAIRHYDNWYFIENTDGSSKLVFRLLEALLSARIAESVSARAAPVLTVPVAR